MQVARGYRTRHSNLPSVRIKAMRIQADRQLAPAKYAGALNRGRYSVNGTSCRLPYSKLTSVAPTVDKSASERASFGGYHFDFAVEVNPRPTAECGRRS